MITVTDKDILASLGQRKGFRVFIALFLLWAIVGGVLYAIIGNHNLFQAIHSVHTPALDQFFIIIPMWVIL